MAIQSSGTITIQDIVDEFGGSTPHSLSEYYRDGANVPGNNTNVPTSGAIDLSDFYGAVNEIVIALTNGATNLNASTLFGSNYTSSVPKRLTVASGVEIGATSGNNVLVIPSGMAGTLIIDNAGTITGYGGAASSNGGTGIRVEVAGVTINNSGTIRAGGGGGGTGGTGGTGGNGSYSSTGSYTGAGTAGCPYTGSQQGTQYIKLGGQAGYGPPYTQWNNSSDGYGCGSGSQGIGTQQGIRGNGSFFSGDQACQGIHGSQYLASSQGSSGYILGQGYGGSHHRGYHAWGQTTSSGIWWRIVGYFRFAGQGCGITTTQSSSGGAGGSGGSGGVGQGYNQSATSGSGGSGGSSGGTNAGAGGTGGTGGTGGAYGNSGSTGATGSSGANGNASNGSGGSSGSSGGGAGYYLSHSGGISSTMNNTGTLTGQSG